MENQTFANRLELTITQKKLTFNDLEKISGIKKQSIQYILKNNLTKSRLSLQLALALNVSHAWLVDGVEDQSFIVTNEVLVFTNISLLISYLTNDIIPPKPIKSITHNKYLYDDSFVFHASNNNTFYYCSKNKKLKSSEYLCLDLASNTYVATKEPKNIKFCFPIIEIKTILIE
ncbi:hypothetical protein ACFX5K_03435 [Rickettsiales bacterium LUAb2]